MVATLAESELAGTSCRQIFEVLFADITESGEALDLSELVRESLPPAFVCQTGQEPAARLSGARLRHR
jgi:hypothetical protein